MDMDLKFVDNHLRRALELVEGSTFTAIDRDIALEHIRQAYEHLRFGDIEALQPIPIEPAEDAEEQESLFGTLSALVDDVVSEDESAEEPNVEVELIMADEEFSYDEPAAELPEEPVIEVAQEPQSIDEELPTVSEEIPTEELTKGAEPVEEQPVIEPSMEEESVEEVDEEPVEEVVAAEPDSSGVAEDESKPVAPFTEQSLFGDDALFTVPAKSSRRRAIMSLYEESAPVLVEVKPIEPAEPIVEPMPEIVADDKVAIAADEHLVEPTEPQPELQVAEEVVAAEPEMVLADKYRQESPATLGESVAPQHTVAESRTVSSLRGAISVADRFMLIRDLFEGDAQLYEKTVDRLDSCETLDDCMIYIVENFSWRPTSDGAKLIMELLQRKFQ